MANPNMARPFTLTTKRKQLIERQKQKAWQARKFCQPPLCRPPRTSWWATRDVQMDREAFNAAVLARLADMLPASTIADEN